MKIIAYTRTSTEKQSLENQRHLILEYAHQRQWLVDNFIEVEMPTNASPEKRKIDLLLSKLTKGDILLTTNLSCLGRNMLETLNLINRLVAEDIKLVFIEQPELSTNQSHAKLLSIIYSYFAESAKTYISIRTKQGLTVAKAQGKQLGRPKGSKNKNGSILSPYQEEIKGYLNLQISIKSITKIINNQLDKSVSYNTFRYFISNNDELRALYAKYKSD